MSAAWLPALLAAAVAAQGGAPIGAEAFRDRLAASIQAATGHSTTAVDERTFRARQVDGTDLTVNIDNAYQQYVASPAELNDIIARFSRLLTTENKMNEPVDRLVVVVRPSNYLELSMAQGADPKHFPLPRPLAGDISQFLAVDGTETIRLATTDDLTRWKLEQSAAWEQAVRNLKMRMGPLSPAQLGEEEGTDGFAAPSGLAPGLLVDPTLCGNGSRGAFEGFLALLYSRDMVLIASGAERKERDRFWETVRTETAADRSLSKTPLTCRGGKWAVATLP